MERTLKRRKDLIKSEFYLPIDENDGDAIIMLQSPVVMKMMHNPTGEYVKIRPWLEIPTDDLYLINYDRIVTMSEINDKQTIHFYERYLNESEDNDLEFDGRVKLNTRLGLVSTVEEARRNLEKIYQNKIEPKET